MKTTLSLTILSLCVFASAQYATGFEASEGYAGSAGGTLLTGQNGWYNPVAGSVDGFVYTYNSNALGLPINTSGGDQFLGMSSNISFSQIVARAQRDIPITMNGVWTVTYDFTGTWVGAPPSVDNLGSFSMQPSTTANYFQTLYRWTDVNNPTTFEAEYGVTDAIGVPSGTALGAPFASPGPEWQALPVNHWYRTTVTWDWNSNLIQSVSIQDLTTGGAKTTAFPVGWYLAGGANNTQGRATPTGIRFFCGGSLTGNVMGYDNLNIGPASTSETLAPTSEQILFGTTNSGGNLASWAADDNNARTICKLFVPSVTSPFVRVNLNYTTTKTTPTAISFNVKVSNHTPGPQAITLSLQDKTNPTVFVNTSVAGAASIPGTTYSGAATPPLQRYVGTGGAMTGRIEIFQTGPSTSLFPCSSFEFAQMVVTG